MLFNSIDFAGFLSIFFILYWFVFNRNLRLQNSFIVASSYLFYSFWDWRFLILILFSTLVDYTIGLKLSNEKRSSNRKLLLWISIIVNLGLLGTFKYFNFFLDSFSNSFALFGVKLEMRSLNIILPIGISFYTFQTLSYTIDIYKKKCSHTRDIIAFAAFVSFFPQLVAGPIERAKNFLPQFNKKRIFNYKLAVDGLRQILWGFFKKIVIADNSAQIVNEIFDNSTDYSGSTLFIGALFFSFQIYGDFSGYSDIAIGTSRLFGFNLRQNFSSPYFSRNIAEFWRKWHISLSSWFRDYLYIPLGGSRGSMSNKVRNIFIIFIVSGFWHGANWTFIFWGIINAMLFLVLFLVGNNRNYLDVVAHGKKLPTFYELYTILVTFCLISFTWIFFRAENLEHAISYCSQIISTSFFTIPKIEGNSLIVLIFVFIIIEWVGREEQYAIAKIGSGWTKSIRWIFYLAIVSLIFIFQGSPQEFIYFQF